MVVLEPSANFYRILKIDNYWNRPKGIHLPVHDPIEKRQELLIDQVRVWSEFSPLEFEKKLESFKTHSKVAPGGRHKIGYFDPDSTVSDDHGRK